jgi:lipopolysaccharide biosynthesis glycosyltransferase
MLVYAKLLFLDNMEDNFIWIDSDCLLLPKWTTIEKSFQEVISKEDKILAACLDENVQGEMQKFHENQAFRRAKNKYFNSGIFLAVPQRWSNFGFSSAWKDIGMKHVDLGFHYHDQDILNYLVSERVVPISREFNSWESVEVNLSPKILHYVGKPKPWNLEGDVRNYYLAKDVLLNYDGLTSESAKCSKILRQIMYWQAEENLEKTLRSLGFIGTKKRFTENFKKSIKMAKRDLFKLFCLRFFAKSWSLVK